MLNNLSSCDLIGLASSLAIVMTNYMSADDASILAAFLTALADNVAIIAIKKSV